MTTPSRPAPDDTSAPKISIVIRWEPEGAGRTLASCLKQRVVRLEILLLLPPGADLAVSADPRVRFVHARPGACDGTMLHDVAEHARGEWLAIVQPGDLIHPDRSARLIAEAEAWGADAVADDQLLFDEAQPSRSRLLLRGRDARRSRWIDEGAFRPSPSGRRNPLDHLAPVVRVATLHTLPARTTNRELVRGLARQGAALRLLPEPLYFRRTNAAVRRGSVESQLVPFVSRQRLIGPTNGSSAYILALAGAVRDAGLSPRLIQPSPAIFGRLPFYRLQPELKVFDTIHVRGGVRMGQWLIAARPGPYVAAIRAKLSSLLRWLGANGAWLQDRAAPYAVATPWVREDCLFVARHAPPSPAAMIADYAFQAEGLPYLLAPEAPSAIVMHDLFHTRAAQFTNGGDSVAAIDRDSEVALLAKADAVIAIQSAEAGFVETHVCAAASLLVPMPAACVSAPQPGNGRHLLFVGSNTAPNVSGLRWFFDTVWPLVRAHDPASVLSVAGTVAAAFPTSPAGVTFLGLVGDLTARYARAGIVISPLREGSGLKIKLVEALAHGKACVVSSVTLQGVEQLAEGAVWRADTPEAFAEAIAVLQSDQAARARLAASALCAARTHFGPERCFADFHRWLRASGGSTPMLPIAGTPSPLKEKEGSCA